MMIFDDVIEKFYNLEAWGARIGVGYHVQIEFGAVEESVTEVKARHGQLSLWLYGAPWRLQSDSLVITGSGQPSEEMEAIGCLNGDRIISIEAKEPYFDVDIRWESGKSLRVFCEGAKSSYLIFFTPSYTYSVNSTGKVQVEPR